MASRGFTAPTMSRSKIASARSYPPRCSSHIAWALRDVLVDEVEAARRLAADQRAERLDVLPLTPRGARHDLARLVDCRARRGRIAMSDGHEGDARVRQREPLVRLHRRRERIVGTGAVR